MISFETLYKIISQLQFSIRGYQDDHDIDEKLNKLFQSMFQQQNLFTNLKMRFLSFANARLSNVLEWKLTDYDKSFYFVPFVVSSNEDLLINEYYYLKNYVKQYSNSYSSDNAWSQIVLSGKAAQLSSILFKKSIIYRVKCDISIKTLSIGYESNCLTILVPTHYFSFYNQENLLDEDADRLPLIKNRHEYIPNENISTYLPLCAEFTEDHYNELCNELVHCLKEINAQHSIFKLYEENHLFDAVIGFANLLITHAYLSLIFKCWVESIPSVVNIDEEHTNSLGIVIWGYYDDCDILECRPLVQIIADRICASFAAHFIDLIGLVQKSQSESLKSAKAAIMSRNMSHNLGSHVMFYIKQKLQSVSKIVDNKVLDNIIPGTLSNIPEIVAKIKENKDIELPFLVGLGRFINYLQERQDYIATIATDYIPANSTISFKDFVYDELKPELRYQRHHSNSDDAGWKSGNLLLDYIAYSEGYRSCDDIEILFGDFNGNTPVKDSNPDKDFQKLREFNIAVPGGVIGRQALFSIFENIIRNAAKHSECRSDNKLVLQLSLLEKDSDILANLKAKLKKSESEIDGEILKNLYFNNSDKYHFLRIKVDMPNPNGVIDTLVDNLADPYLDDNGVMSETTKGLKEMRISAAWLRGYSIDTAIPSNEPPVISIYSELFNKNDENDKRVTLSYILCIQKPCRVAFVKDEQDREYKTINEVLGLYGCKVFVNPFKLEKQEECDKLINEIANYEIVCMPKHLEEQLRSFVSSRYITDNETTNGLFEDLRKSTDKKVINNLVGSIYEEWFRDAYNGDTPKLVIADGKAVQNKKKADGSLSCDSNVILTTTGMIADEDNASNQKSVSGNNASISETETTVTQEDVRGAVVYSTHFKGLASKSDGPDGYNTWLQNAICIESVTGNNSTARLIRQDEWTKEWKTKILSAGMARVAIFDERIFSSFISRESVLKHDNVSVEEIQNLIAEYKSKEQSDDLILEFCKNMVDKYGINDDDSSNIYYNFSTIEEVIYCLEITYHNDVAQKNHERRIWAFDIRVPEKVNNIVEIIGYNVLIGDRVGAYIERKTDAIITIAKISRHSETGQYNVELCDDKKVFANGNVFDYISIHQGVLDKIYTAFGVKEAAIEKFKVTNALHRCFSKYALNEYNEPVINEEDKIVNKPFLPNFIIHSGRSKPSEKDMPQPQPFVQFAALDHAVKDCKYTLVELLATAHYEKGNNNN